MSSTKKCAVLMLFVIIHGFPGAESVSWEEWWTYDGISGPSFWGLINPEWNLCNQGKRQSPVDIDPKKLLFDPLMEDVKITNVETDVVLSNSGHGVVLTLDSSSDSSDSDPGSNGGGFMGQQQPPPAAAASWVVPSTRVNISGGPVAGYNYPVSRVSLHFGLDDRSGSEHSVDGRRFVGEVQLMGFNADLYENYTAASLGPNGLVGVSVLVQIGELSNQALRKVTNQLAKIQYGGQSVSLSDVSLSGFLPEGARGFMTYQGSMTEPGCWETVDWIVMNRPIYITMKQLLGLRKLMQGEQSDPRAPLGGNFRPIQPLNSRGIRTNVMVAGNRESKCPTLHKNLEYKASSKQPADGGGGRNRGYKK